MCIECFLFKDTATTEIYTYWHTLALHDALPICCCRRQRPAPALARFPLKSAARTRRWKSLLPRTRSVRTCTPPMPSPPIGRSSTAAKTLTMLQHRSASPRSEEHTSELQSLMRISYAVFCLKKKKTREYTNTNYDNITNIPTRGQ